MTVRPAWTAGQEQALRELRLLASDGPALQILRTWHEPGHLLADISVDCSNLRPADAGGVPLRPRERLIIGVPERFPFTIPLVWTPHTRWVGTPHVQWGRQLCLYISPSAEWNPSDGMAGFIERLMLWLERAAAGELDAPGEPLHPPVAYPSGEAGLVVARADAPLTDGGHPWLGVAVLRRIGERRADLVGWRSLDEPWPHTRQTAQAAAGGGGVSDVMLAFAVVLPRPLAFEYPGNAAALVDALTRYGIDAEILLGALGVVAGINRVLTPPAGPLGPPPLYLVVGAPARGVAGAADRVTHLAVWRLPPLAERIARLVPQRYSGSPELARLGREVLAIGQDWLASAETAWAVVYEARPEIVTARDAATSASWLTGKRVLVLGTGALGAPISEACVRGGAAHVAVADRGVVHPGVLVRQPYQDADIGHPKALVLAERLRRIRPDAVVEPWFLDVVSMEFDTKFAPSSFDLIIDATADRTVRTLIERQRTADRDTWPALATVLIGHDARRGIAAISHRGSSGAGLDTLRRLSLTARADTTGDMADTVEDFFPDPPRRTHFQPEPGCSDVTFVGSAADVTGLAGQLFTGILHALATATGNEGMDALVVRMPTAPGEAVPTSARWFCWPADLVLRTADGQYEVRLAAQAVAEMRAEARRGARVRAKRVETGGSLLGALDPAAGVVWVDEATGPPPDSLLSESHFEHGIEGVEQRITARVNATARVTSFIGMWHSHPYGCASPSQTDKDGMRKLVLPIGTAPPRALLLIAGGAARWEPWLATGNSPDWYAQVVERPNGASGSDSPQSTAEHLMLLPNGSPQPARRHWRRRWLRIFRWPGVLRKGSR